jgi:hypothetical protein
VWLPKAGLLQVGAFDQQKTTAGKKKKRSKKRKTNNKLFINIFKN